MKNRSRGPAGPRRQRPVLCHHRSHVLTLLVLVLFSSLAACGGSMSPSKAYPGGSGDSSYGEAEPMSQPAPDMDLESMDEQTMMRVSDTRSALATGGSADGAAPAAAAPPAAPPPPRKEASDGTTTQPKKVASPLLIYRAEINMGVFESRRTIDRTEKMAQEMGGYLVRRSDREIVIRVPSKKFQTAMLKISGFGDVLHKNVEVEDVTEKFFDLTVRLKNARAMRDRFEELLKKSESVKDALLVERELERITTRLETLEGKLKLMKELIAFSTITLRLSPQATDRVNPKVNLPFPWLKQLGLPTLLSM